MELCTQLNHDCQLNLCQSIKQPQNCLKYDLHGTVNRNTRRCIVHTLSGRRLGPKCQTDPSLFFRNASNASPDNGCRGADGVGGAENCRQMNNVCASNAVLIFDLVQSSFKLWRSNGGCWQSFFLY